MKYEFFLQVWRMQLLLHLLVDHANIYLPLQIPRFANEIILLQCAAKSQQLALWQAESHPSTESSPYYRMPFIIRISEGTVAWHISNVIVSQVLQPIELHENDNKRHG